MPIDQFDGRNLLGGEQDAEEMVFDDLARIGSVVMY
jgi:hypothetical protein